MANDLVRRGEISRELLENWGEITSGKYFVICVNLAVWGVVLKEELAQVFTQHLRKEHGDNKNVYYTFTNGRNWQEIAGAMHAIQKAWDKKRTRSSNTWVKEQMERRGDFFGIDFPSLYWMFGIARSSQRDTMNAMEIISVLDGMVDFPSGHSVEDLESSLEEEIMEWLENYHGIPFDTIAQYQ